MGSSVCEHQGFNWAGTTNAKWSIDFSKKSTTPENKTQNTSDITLISSLVSMWYDKVRVETIIADIDTTLSLESRTIEAIRRLAK